ncbi:MAG: T9SS type A sorting domain-containing protein [Bacteroidota bacterium]
MGSTTVGLENEGIIKIDECGDNGIFMKGTFLNQGPAKIWIGQNAGNITEIGLFINAGASFTNKGNSELLIDNVGEEGIYLNLFNPSFLNQDNSKTIIGKNGPIGGVTHAAIKANSSTISNQDCAELKIYDFIDQANGSLLNEGFLMINTANAHTTTGSFINNGVLQFGVVNPISALVNNDLLIYNTSTGICTLSPVFVEGGTNNFNLVGSNSYLDENLTNVAANYEGATNSFNLINYPESQTNLYFEVAGNSCTFLIDMEYDPVYPAIPNPGKLTWIGGNSSAWEDGCNWLPIKVPTTDDDLIIPTSTTYPVIADGIVAQGKSLIMRTDTKLTIDYGGSLALDGASGIGANIDGKLTNNGTFSVDNTVGHGIILASRSADFLSRGDVFIGQNGSIGGAGIRLLGQGNFTINDNGTGTTDLEPTLLIDNTNSHAISSSFGQLVFKGTTLSTPVQIIVRIGALGPNSINGSGVHLATSAYTEIRGTEMYIDNALNGLQNNSGIIFYDFNSYLEVGGSGNTIPGVGVSNDDVFNHKNGIIKVSNTTSSALKDTDRFNTNGGGTLQIDGEISGVTNIRGSLLPGSSPGIITTTNDLSIANATLEIEIDGTMQGVDYDWLDVGGIATLGGTLKPVINYIPTTGDRIVFLTATSITNTFSTIDPVLPAGWGLDYSIPGEIALVFDPSIFPVELLEFDAKILGESTFLNWATASELNNDGFEIEHRTEGSIWGKVGFVFGVGNSDQVNTYEFRHLDPQMGKNYYRLKQIDFDGKYEYSKVLEINFTPSAQGMSLYPNPASDQVNIDVFRSFTIGKLQVFDLKGQLIYQTALEKNQMSSRLQTQNWASGAYQVILHIDNSLYTSKFMLSR